MTDDKKTTRVFLYVTEEQRRQLRIEAAKQSKSVAQLLYDAATKITGEDSDQ